MYFCKGSDISTGINKKERVDRTGNNNVSMCSAVSELTQMAGVDQDMETDSTTEDDEDLSGNTKMSGVTMNQEVQEGQTTNVDISAITGVSGVTMNQEEIETLINDEEVSVVTGITGISANKEKNKSNGPNKVTLTKLDFNKERGTNSYNKDSIEKDQLEEEAEADPGNDNESTIAALTGITMTQEQEDAPEVNNNLSEEEKSKR
eukprot:13573411-Ditylum_brightwellii.AAC.2